MRKLVIIVVIIIAGFVVCMLEGKTLEKNKNTMTVSGY